MQVWLTRLMTAAWIGAAACSGGDDTIDAPCADPRVIVTNDAELAAALDAATAGTCIVLREGTYQGPIVISKAGITVAGATGEDVRVVGADGAAVRVDAEDVTVIGLEVSGGEVGVAWRGPRGSMSLMDIVSARAEAVQIKCEDQDCLRPSERIDLADVTIRGSDTGLLIFGARAHLLRVTVSDHVSLSLTGGAGIWVLGGAEVTMEDCTVQNNLSGINADGAATRLSMTNTIVSDNDERGVWAQGLDGGGGAALSIERSTIERNGIVGVGTLGTTGVRMTDVAVRATIAKPLSVNVMQTEHVGDGLGLFGGTSDVVLSATTLEDNERAQGVIDDAGVSVTLMSNVVVAGGMHLVVVQNSNNMVTVPPALVSNVGSPLFVKDDSLVVPMLP